MTKDIDYWHKIYLYKRRKHRGKNRIFMKYMVQTTIVKFVLHMFRTTTNSKGKKTLRKNILYPSTNLMKSKMTSRSLSYQTRFILWFFCILRSSRIMWNVSFILKREKYSYIFLGCFTRRMELISRVFSSFMRAIIHCLFFTFVYYFVLSRMLLNVNQV